MNGLWAGMILLAIGFAAINGKMDEVTTAALESAREAVDLSLTMLGVMSFWMGLMEVARKAGILAGLVRRMNPVLNFLFPRLAANHPAREHIATNMIANIFGLGWAATPAGLLAMQALAEDCASTESQSVERLTENIRQGSSSEKAEPLDKARKRKKGRKFDSGKRATNEMCTFLIINISSLQLIPVNIIAYRSQYGSVNPAAIVGPAILATMISTLAAVIFCKVAEWRTS